MTLSILWFILIAVLWTMYLVLEGFDYGVGMLQGFLARDDRERTQALRTIGPHWDGNEVWLLTAGGATFAAFPEWYATMFSGMYLALFLILLALIVRVCAVEWRSKLKSEQWRSVWDRVHAVSALLVPLLFGVAFANLVQGMKIEVVTHGTNAVVAPADVPSSLNTAVHQLLTAHSLHPLGWSCPGCPVPCSRRSVLGSQDRRRPAGAREWFRSSRDSGCHCSGCGVGNLGTVRVLNERLGMDPAAHRSAVPHRLDGVLAGCLA